MLNTHSWRQCRLAGFRTNVAAVAVCIGSALASPVAAEERGGGTRYDRAALSEIARDVLTRGSIPQSVPEPTAPAAPPLEEISVDAAAEPEAPVAHIAPVREGTRVATPPGSAMAVKPAREAAAPTGYRSNSS